MQRFICERHQEMMAITLRRWWWGSFLIYSCGSSLSYVYLPDWVFVCSRNDNIIVIVLMMELWWYVFYVVCTKVHPDTPGQGVNNVNDQNNANRGGGGGGE